MTKVTLLGDSIRQNYTEKTIELLVVYIAKVVVAWYY